MKSRTVILPGALCLAAIVSAQQAPQPLSIEDKFRLYLRETYRPAPLGKTVFFGAIAPTHGGAGDWGVGADARAHRIESALATHLARHTFEFAGDAALHIDSRYRRSESDEFGSRLRHALASTVVAYTDTGARTIAIPRIGSAYGTAYLSNMWYPQGHNGWQDAAIRGTAFLGWTACRNLAKEFWPDIQRRFRRPAAQDDSSH